MQKILALYSYPSFVRSITIIVVGVGDGRRFVEMLFVGFFHFFGTDTIFSFLLPSALLIAVCRCAKGSVLLAFALHCLRPLILCWLVCTIAGIAVIWFNIVSSVAIVLADLIWGFRIVISLSLSGIILLVVPSSASVTATGYVSLIIAFNSVFSVVLFATLAFNALNNSLLC